MVAYRRPPTCAITPSPATTVTSTVSGTSARTAISITADSGGSPLTVTSSASTTMRSTGAPGYATGASVITASSNGAQVDDCPKVTVPRSTPSPRQSSSTTQSKPVDGTPTALS